MLNNSITYAGLIKAIEDFSFNRPCVSYLTSSRYTCLPQAWSACKFILLIGKDQSRIKNRKKG